MFLVIIGQLLTAISYIIYWVSRYFKTKKSMLVADNISRVVAIIAFICLDCINAIQSTIICIIRNYLGTKVIKSSKVIKLITCLGLLLVSGVLFIISFRGIETILVAICSSVNIYGVIMLKEQNMRLASLCGSGFYASYLFVTGNYTGFICEIVTAFVVLTSWIKYNRKEVFSNDLCEG